MRSRVPTATIADSPCAFPGSCECGRTSCQKKSIASKRWKRIDPGQHGRGPAKLTSAASLPRSRTVAGLCADGPRARRILAITANRLGATPCPVSATRAPSRRLCFPTMSSCGKIAQHFRAPRLGEFDLLLVTRSQLHQHLAHGAVFQELLRRCAVGLEAVAEVGTKQGRQAFRLRARGFTRSTVDAIASRLV